MTEPFTADDMSLEEKRTWAGAGIIVVAFLAYLGIITVRGLQAGPLIEVSWVAPMAWTLGIAAAASFLAIGLLGLRTPKAARKKDVRDDEIERFGDQVGQAFAVMGGLAALILLMIDVDRFWAAHSLFFGFMLSGILGSFAKLAAYREGIDSL
jgi:hypothetical protein